MKRFISILFLSLFVLIFFSACAPLSGNKFQEYSRIEPLTGTFVEVKLDVPRSFMDGIPRTMDRLFMLARRLERKFSNFDPKSEVNALNFTKKRKVSRELFSLISDAKRIGALTGGEFDITIAPVMKKKGFYRNMPAEITSAIPDNFNGMGWENVKLTPENREIVLGKDTWIDVSGIASGYIVDRMSQFLRKKGINSFLINDGGDIFCSTKGKITRWSIGVKKPLGKGMVIVLGVSDKAVVTSGDYENVIFDKTAGKNISHIIKPASAEAKYELPSSITVIAPNCTLADGLSTGMMAMGIENAITLADKLEDVEIIAVERSNGEYIVRFSEGAKEYVK